MGIIPDFMARTGSEQAWWEDGKRRKATQLDANAGLNEWTKASGLDFSVATMPSGFKKPDGEWHECEGRKTIVREDNLKRLGEFSDRYVPHQPSQIVDFFRDFLLVDDRFELSTMGSMKGGALIWGLAKFKPDVGAIAGDAHELYALLGTSYNGMWATFASATSIRAVCQNTIEASIYGGAPTFRMAHNAPFDKIRQERAIKALADIAGDFEKYAAFAERLKALEMTRAQTLAFLNEVLTGKAESPSADDITGRAKGAMADLVDALSVTLGETGGVFNGWTALNAVTRYVDHDRTTRRDATTGESTEMARLFSANFGTGAVMKKKAATLLTAAADAQLIAA